MFKAFFGSAAVFVNPVFAMVASSVIAIALAAGPAQARGPGIKLETAELLPVASLSDEDCAAESFGDTGCSANANVQRSTYQLFGGAPFTLFAAIAENLLPGVGYNLYNLDVEPIGSLGDADCTNGNSIVIGDIPIDGNGKLAEPTEIGSVQEVLDVNVVFVCRVTDGSMHLGLTGAPRLILSGTLARGAKGGGKNKNR